MYWGPNVTGTENVIRACREKGVKRLIFTSSPSVVFGDEPHDGADESLPYPESYLCHYPASKAKAEQLVLAAHEIGVLHTLALRPHLIWGPGDPNLIPRVVEMAKKKKLMQVGDGKNLVSVVYVENAAQAQLVADETYEKNLSHLAVKRILWRKNIRFICGSLSPKSLRVSMYQNQRER